MNTKNKDRIRKIKHRMPEILVATSVVAGLVAIVYIKKDLDSNNVTLDTTRGDLAKLKLAGGSIPFETDLGNFVLTNSN